MPEMVWVNNGRQKFEFQDTITIGNDKSCTISINSLEEKSILKIYKEDEKWFVENVSKNVNVRGNAQTVISPGQRKILYDKAIFALSKTLDFVMCYVNKEAVLDVQKITAAFETDVLIRETDELLLFFWKNFKPIDPTNPHSIYNHVKKFFAAKFRVDTFLLYAYSGTKWANRCAWRDDTSSVYKPSSNLFNKCLSERSPVSYTSEDVDEENAIMSIVQRRIKKAFLFPLKQGKDIVGIIYVDCKENVLSDKDFYKIIHILEAGVSAIVKMAFLMDKEVSHDIEIIETNKEKQKEVSDKLAFSDSPQKDMIVPLEVAINQEIQDSIPTKKVRKVELKPEKKELPQEKKIGKIEKTRKWFGV